MGDRTSVTLYILAKQEPQATQIVKKNANYYDLHNDQLNHGLASYVFSDIHMGELDFLPLLKKAGIAYKSDWAAGHEYGPGIEVLRFTPAGEAIVKTIYESDNGIDLGTLACLLDKPDQLRQLVVDRILQNDYLPWENQEEYGRLYMTNQLINPSQP